jgi:hypothetical protein
MCCKRENKEINIIIVSSLQQIGTFLTPHLLLFLPGAISLKLKNTLCKTQNKNVFYNPYSTIPPYEAMGLSFTTIDIPMPPYEALVA